MSHYQPPLTLTPCMLALVAEIGRVGLLSAQRGGLTPQLRRGNRIRTIQASLAIENDTLYEQPFYKVGHYSFQFPWIGA